MTFLGYMTRKNGLEVLILTVQFEGNRDKAKHIRKRNVTFLGYMMRKNGLEMLILTVQF